jgi:hypothetical protein
MKNWESAGKSFFFKILVRITSSAFSLCFLTFAHAQAPAGAPIESLLAADLRDWAAFEGERFPWAALLLEDLRGAGRSELLPSRVNLHSEGIVKGREENTVLGVRLARPPRLLAQGRTEFELWLSYNLTRTTEFRRVRVVLGGYALGEGGRILSRQVVETLAGSEISWRLQVDLYQRQLLLTADSHPGLFVLFPIAVGMFDEGVTRASGGQTRLVTPEYRTAFLRKHQITAERPKGFGFRPFIPLSLSDGTVQNIAFHVMPTKIRRRWQVVRVPELKRGFLSNGCMRMRQRDLYELYYLFTRSAGDAMPAQVLLETGQTWVHPFPHFNERYARVRNFGTAERPLARREPHEPGGRPLRVHEYVNAAPPSLSEIVPVDGENRSDPATPEYTEPSLDLDLPGLETREEIHFPEWELENSREARSA